MKWEVVIAQLAYLRVLELEPGSEAALVLVLAHEHVPWPLLRLGLDSAALGTNSFVRAAAQLSSFLCPCHFLLAPPAKTRCPALVLQQDAVAAVRLRHCIDAP